MSYLDVLVTVSLFSAASAMTGPALVAEEMLDAHSRCTHVKSHAMHLPLSHGTREAPSGRRPSLRTRPIGSMVAGILADLKASLTRLLHALCRANRETILEHERA